MFQLERGWGWAGQGRCPRSRDGLRGQSLGHAFISLCTLSLKPGGEASISTNLRGRLAQPQGQRAGCTHPSLPLFLLFYQHHHKPLILLREPLTTPGAGQLYLLHFFKLIH